MPKNTGMQKQSFSLFFFLLCRYVVISLWRYGDELLNHYYRSKIRMRSCIIMTAARAAVSVRRRDWPSEMLR